jgi:pimeloyl-ACP methyl ester carboxylesterase
MAHGFAAQRDFRLPAFAEKFVGKGLAVLLFDYRNFGMSDGAPRNLVSPHRHLQDWAAAVWHARGLEQVDTRRIGLWGTSFSGGHVLVTAARYPWVSAVVSQVPFVDGLAVARSMPFKYATEGIAHGLRDMVRAVREATPHFVPVVAEPGTFGLMSSADSLPGYMALVPDGSSWKNRAPARIALTLPLYRPIRYATRIKCPVMIVSAEKDSLIGQASVVKTARRIRECKLVRLPVGHFDVYVGEEFERVADFEGDFLRDNLGL